MIHTRRNLAITLLGLLAFAPTAFAQKAQPQVQPLKTVVGAIRQERDLMALRQFAGEAQGRSLLGEEWAKGTPEQRKEFVAMFHEIFAKMAFPKIRQSFENLDAITYAKPQLEGTQAKVVSTILINHPLKKQEMEATYTVVKEGARWKVLDVLVKGDAESMLDTLRVGQIEPIMKQGGWPHLLAVMKKALAEKALAQIELK